MFSNCVHLYLDLKRFGTISRVTTLSKWEIPFQKRLGSFGSSFLLRLTPFQMRFGVQEGKQEVTKVLPYKIMSEILPSILLVWKINMPNPIQGPVVQN